MKIIDGPIKEIILDENDSIIVTSLKKNNSKLLITLKNNALHIDDIPIERIENLKEEDAAIKIMQDYLKKNPKEK